MSHSPANHPSDIWYQAISYVLIGIFFYAIPWSAFAAPAVQSAQQTALRIQGSNTIGAELAPALVTGLLQKESYRDIRVRPGSQPNEQVITAVDAKGKAVTISLAAHGSSTGFKALASGQADIAASSRPIKADEAKMLGAQGDLRSRNGEHIIALDGLAVIVHPKNPIKRLDVAQLAAIFSGELTDWSAVGGSSGPIDLYARDDNSGTFDTFKELVLAGHGKGLAGSAQRYESSEALSDAVFQNRAAIGFIGLPYVRQSRALMISDGGASGLLPTTATIATEDYPLARRLFLYTPPSSPNPWVKALAGFAQSPEGQAIVSRNGFIGQQPQLLSVQPTSAMPAPYQDLAKRGQRLSLNFRFSEGSATLDNKALSDIERLIQYVAQDGQGKQIALVGFSDEKADDARSQLLSRLRAMAVRREMIKAGVTPQQIEGLGNVLPVAANDDQAGRIRNRRVEVWVY
jgi:phosphate transport system substrate-binding protein